MSDAKENKIGRREFLGAAAAANFMFIKPELVRGSAANSTVQLALLGCGGRGTGVAESFVANAGARIAALGDLFENQLTTAKKTLDAANAKKGHAEIDVAQLFGGPKAYEKLLASKAVDAVYIATPVYMHPEHFEAGVASGKHVYVEKPAGVDVPGVKRMLRAAEKAKGHQSVTMGLQLRYATPYVEQVKRIHGGDLGDIVTGLVNYYAGAIERPDWPSASPAEKRLRNWIFDRALSGDIVVEQNVHVIDFTSWVLNGHPLKAVASAGRKGRKDSGDCSSHYSAVITYPNDVHITFASTQFINGSWDVAMRFYGTKGNSEAHYEAPVNITGDKPWEFPGLGKPVPATDTKAAQTGFFSGALDDADAQKQKSFIGSITSGAFLNEITPGAESTVAAIMIRMAATKGSAVTWEEAWKSTEVLDPKLDIGKMG